MASTDPDQPNRDSAGGDATQVPSIREVLSLLPLSVAVVTAVDDEGPTGLTIGSFLSLSVDPPRAGFLAALSSTSLPRVRKAGNFCVNLLTADQAHLAGAFAAQGVDKFADVSWRSAPGTGSPVLGGVAAWVDCRLAEMYETGDHCIVIGDVVGLDSVPGTQSLLFHQGRFFGLPAQEPATS